MNLVIVLLILFLLYSNNVFLHSSLGKFILLSLIVIITLNTNKYIGLVFAVVSILLLHDEYKPKFLEGMENKEDSEEEEDKEKETAKSKEKNGSNTIEFSITTENEETGYKPETTTKEIINNEPERNMVSSKDDVDLTANIDAVGDNSGEENAPQPNEPAVVETFANYM